MTARHLALPCLLLLAAITVAGAAPKTPTAVKPTPAPAAKPASFLPDTAVLARVSDRAIVAIRFVDAYFASYGPVRPRPDSLGRVEFLNSMINKEVMGLTALKVNRPLEFEDRVVMREYTERVLSNALYQRVVMDSVEVSEEDVRKVYAQYSREQHYRRIRCDDPYQAADVRARIVAGTLAWNDAVKRYSRPASETPDGDIGWIKRNSIDLRTAELVWDLAPGAVSPVVNAPDGFFLMQLVESRKVDPPVFDPMRPTLITQIRDLRASQRADRLQARVGARIEVVYDTTNIRWAAAKFHGLQAVQQQGKEVVLDIGAVGADLIPADTARVLARHRYGRVSLGDFLHEYNQQSPMMRQPIGDVEAFRGQLDAIMLEPYMAVEARAMGLDKDAGVVNVIELKREEILVDKMFADSVQSKIWIRDADRRRYYDQHIAQFVTYPEVRFAAIVRATETGADSVRRRLDKGEKAADILHADSLAGETSGSIRELRDEGRGGPYHKILFGELRPGQSTVVGPDKEGTWMVLQLLEFDPGRQLPFAEVETLVDESLQNIQAEAKLKQLLARLRKRYRIVAHPEWVMRINLVDPALPRRPAP